MGNQSYCEAALEASLPQRGPFADLVVKLQANNLIDAEALEYVQVRACK